MACILHILSLFFIFGVFLRFLMSKKKMPTLSVVVTPTGFREKKKFYYKDQVLESKNSVEIPYFRSNFCEFYSAGKDQPGKSINSQSQVGEHVKKAGLFIYGNPSFSVKFLLPMCLIKGETNSL